MREWRHRTRSRDATPRGGHNSSSHSQANTIQPVTFIYLHTGYSTSSSPAIHVDAMPKRIMTDSDFISTAAARTRDLQAAASLLDLHRSGATEGATHIMRPTTRSQARVDKDMVDGDETEAAESSQQGEQGRKYLRPTSKTNANIQAEQNEAIPRRRLNPNSRSIKENKNVEVEQVQAMRSNAPQRTNEGHEPRRSVRLQNKVKRKADAEGAFTAEKNRRMWRALNFGQTNMTLTLCRTETQQVVGTSQKDQMAAQRDSTSPQAFR